MKRSYNDISGKNVTVKGGWSLRVNICPCKLFIKPHDFNPNCQGRVTESGGICPFLSIGILHIYCKYLLRGRGVLGEWGHGQI